MYIMLNTGRVWEYMFLGVDCPELALFPWHTYDRLSMIHINL